MTKDYQPTIDRIYELVPQLKKLQRGKYLNGEGISWGVILDTDFNGKVKYAHGNQTREISITKANRLLVIEPTLEAVLEALRESGNLVKNHDISLEICKGGIYLFFHDYGQLYWQYHKPFQEQSEEAKDFITKILLP